eukprot:m51a1_g7374 hypothetical protein (285) ;mRNA; f:75152-76006
MAEPRDAIAPESVSLPPLAAAAAAAAVPGASPPPMLSDPVPPPGLSALSLVLTDPFLPSLSPASGAGTPTRKKRRVADGPLTPQGDGMAASSLAPSAAASGRRKVADWRGKSGCCAEPGCARKASYGLKGGRAEFCATHKREGHCNVFSRVCREPTCCKQASFGDPGGEIEWCAKHKKENQVDLRHRKCLGTEDVKCSKMPSYGEPDGPALYCVEHKMPWHEYKFASRKASKRARDPEQLMAQAPLQLLPPGAAPRGAAQLQPPSSTPDPGSDSATTSGDDDWQ